VSDNKKFIHDLVEEVEGASLGVDEVVTDFLDSGNYALNYVMSGDLRKGYPIGRVVEIFGDPSTGKSLCIYTAIAEFQRRGGVVILDDTEYAFSESFGKMLGINCEELIILHSNTVEEHFETIFLGYTVDKKKKEPLVSKLLERFGKGKIMVCLDSVAQLSTRHEQEVKLDRPDMAKAKQLRAGIRLIVKPISEHNILYLLSNHTIAAIGDMWNPKTTPGGKAIPFQSSLRLELEMGKKKLDDNDQPIGVITRVRCQKNKISIPFRHTVVEIDFRRGLNRYSGLLDTLVNMGVVELKGSWYSFGEEKFQKGDFDLLADKILSSIYAEPKVDK